MEALKSLVERARTGQTTAYEELVRRFQDMAYGYAYSVLGDWHLAQDAAQEAFVEALNCLSTLRQARAFPGWFKRIVYKHCDRTMRRRDHRTASIEALPESPSHTPGPHEVVEQAEQNETVLQAVRCLPEREREVTMLYYIDGYSQAEIADFLEVPSSTVKSRLYTSRRRLKERITDMVRDTLQSSALPESFAEETLAQAVARAAELNKERQFDEAEGLLRDVLGKAPDHPGALKELNRTLMWGQYEDQRFDERWNELVENGRAILAAGSDDEYVYHELARTLMYIPRMQEAVAHVRDWIGQKGPNPERLGMLAWATGCVADYDRAESLWDEFLAMAADEQDVKAQVFELSQVTLALVDCFASAGETARAVRVAQAGWELYAGVAGALRGQYRKGEENWPLLFHRVGLSLDEVVRYQLEKLEPIAEDDLLRQGAALCIRAWIDEADTLIAGWLDWVRACAEADKLSTLGHLHHRATMALRQTGRPETLNAWAGAIRQWLKTVPGEDAAKLYKDMIWAQYNGWAYYQHGDLDGAERVGRQAVEEAGYVIAGCFLVEAAVRRGEPTPPDVLQFIEENGIEAIDEYGMTGWYVTAREAAAAGDLDKAFAALEKAINYWSNPPLIFDRHWEKDAYWGDLRENPEYKRIYREKRERIGPIFGELHYFPGW